MDTLSVVIITRDEEANIRRCIESVSFADEIIVIDSGSTDNTRELAWEAGATVHEIGWRGYGPAKAYGVEQAASEWVLSVDADEAVSPELATEIKAVLSGDAECAGYEMPRMTNFLGRWIRHGAWYPDRVLRLFRRAKGTFDDAAVHESVQLDGQIGRFRGDLLHYSYPNLEFYFDKSNRYTTLGAEEAFRRGRRAPWFDLVFRPPATFIKHFVLKQGFRDGAEGFLISVLSSMATLAKYAKLRDLARQQRKDEGEDK